MTEEELAALLKMAYLEGHKDGRIDGANIVMGYPYDSEEKQAEHYVQRFFVKENLAKGRKFFGR